MAEIDEHDRIGSAFASGTDGGLEAAYRAYGAVVYTFCRRTLEPDLAAEATQDVFVSAWRARATFDRSKGTLVAWLIGIAKRRVIDTARSHGRHASRRSPEATGDLAAPADVDRIGDRMLVADALRGLPDRTRQVIELHYLQELSHAEVADRTDLPLGTVKSDIRRGLAKIRRHLETTHV